MGEKFENIYLKINILHTSTLFDFKEHNILQILLTYFVIIVWFKKVDTYNYIPILIAKLLCSDFSQVDWYFLEIVWHLRLPWLKFACVFSYILGHIRKCGNIYVGINYMSEWIGSTINVCIELKSVKNVQFWEAAMFMSRNKFELLLFCPENEYFTPWR